MGSTLTVAEAGRTYGVGRMWGYSTITVCSRNSWPSVVRATAATVTAARVTPLGRASSSVTTRDSPARPRAHAPGTRAPGARAQRHGERPGRAGAARPDHDVGIEPHVHRRHHPQGSPDLAHRLVVESVAHFPRPRPVRPEHRDDGAA